ncbi:MAG: hypothetical protein MJB57_02050, partial [Gemmatimonadetes bacterium]|nr:hypothetical protein [Gemmatimonadota bacterium]
TDDDRVACFICLDIHHGLTLDIPVDALVRASRRTPDGFPVPPSSWLLFHVVQKLYWEGVHTYGQGLHQYADVARLIPRMSERDLEECIGLLRDYNLTAAGHYVFRRVPQEIGDRLPRELADFVESGSRPEADRTPSALNDFGDMWPKLFGHR